MIFSPKIKNIIIFSFLIFILSTFLLSLILYEVYFPKAPVSKEKITFVIQKGEGVRDIANNLEEKGLIRNRFSFLVYVFTKEAMGKLQAGKYLLSPSMTIPEIARKLIAGEVAKEKITIIEGWDLADIARSLEEKRILKQEDFYRVAGFPIFKISGDFSVGAGSSESNKCFDAWPLLQSRDFSEEFSFLKDKPTSLNLEGYLFPDTYEIEKDANAEMIVRKILKNYDRKLTPELREEIGRQGKTIFKVITMASLLEKEVKTLEDKKLVSGILWKRLEIGMPLQVDATVLYSVGRKTGSISAADIGICSPYNTYKYRDLPIGPISNPGLESIIAAVYSKESSYWYYLSTPQGETLFSETLAEHNIKKVKYLNH